MRIFSTIFFLFCVFLIVNAQEAVKYSGFIAPVNPPFSFSGGFGELRTNHFHTGLDFRTGGAIGKPIYAVKDGYVSRVNVSPTGYGLALYLDHPDGTTSVYGHLSKFHPKVAERVKEEQYYREQFSVDITFSKKEIEFKQGEIIAWSGNTGSSGGPHLHFEIRNTRSENALNPLFYKMGITDNSAPKILSLYIYPVTDNSHVNRGFNKKRFDLLPDGKNFRLKENVSIEVFGQIGLGIQAEDYFSGGGMKCGIYSTKVLVDGIQQYGFQMDELSFNLGRYINTHIDYEEKIRNSRSVHLLFQQPGNRLRFYHNNENSGFIAVDDNKSHDVEIVVCDAFQNCTKLIFKLVSKSFNKRAENQTYSSRFRYDNQNVFENEQIRVNIPEGALGSDLNFNYSSKPSIGLYSPIHQVHNRFTPVMVPFSLAIKAEGFNQEWKEKLLIVDVNTETGKKSAIGGDFSNGWVFARSSVFGNFAVAVDTIAPVINSLSIKERKTLADANKLVFTITDNLSGIKTYRGEIDGKWVLFEYDPKNKMLVHYFDKTKMDLGKSHQLVLTVGDAKQNQKIYKATFYK